MEHRKISLRLCGFALKNDVALTELDLLATSNYKDASPTGFEVGKNWDCLNLECADKSALWNWATCRPVGKRRRVAALQIMALPKNCSLAGSSDITQFKKIKLESPNIVSYK
jgi:hypothetical protein